MNYFILTETEFFQHISGKKMYNLKSAYDHFVMQLVELYHKSPDSNQTFVALTYAEIELQYHYVPKKVYNAGIQEEELIYIRKALAFIRKTLEYLGHTVPTVSTSPTSPSPTSAFSSSLHWKGTLVNLMELISSLDYSGLITDESGKRLSFAGIVSAFEKLFNVSIPKPYDLRADLARRKKNYSVLLPKLKETFEKNIAACGNGK